MKVIFGIGKVKRIEGGIVALGVFDGLHRAHIKVLEAVVRFARKEKRQAVVITFSPHPQNQLQLYSLEHRIRLFQELGIDTCIVINFNSSFARVSAVGFLENVLLKRVRPERLLVGENFTFGYGGRGNVGLLRKYARRYNFKLKVFPLYKLQGRVISSTYIRRLIQEGQLKLAENFLGRRVSILGTVIKGDGLADKLGFPTANIKPHHEVLPPAGVYSVGVSFEGEKYQGICYIGRRPTLLASEEKATHVEVHIFAFRKKIYGRVLEIQFIKKIRGERKFSSLSLLVKQVKKDITHAKS